MKANNMKIGAVAGSFDPITYGHLWLIQRAAELVDNLYVVVANNPDKKGLFSHEERAVLCDYAFQDEFSHKIYTKITIKHIENDLLFDWAEANKVTHVFRGLRNIQDFSYEQSMTIINRGIDANIETVFFITPPELTAISSSVVRGLVGFNKWENRLEQYVPQSVIQALSDKCLK